MQDTGAETATATAIAPSGDEADRTPLAVADAPAASQDDTAGDAGADGADKPKGETRIQKRIAQLTRRAGESERLAEFWRQEAERRVAPTESAQAIAPRREDFANYEEYVRADARHAALQAVAERNQQDAGRRKIVDTEAASLAFQDEMRRSAQADPDLGKAWAKVSAPDYPVSHPMVEFLTESDAPEALISYLADNRDEAARIYGMEPAAAFRTLARIEASASGRGPAPATKAPPPVPTVGGAARTPTRSIDAMPQSEVDKLVKKWAKG